MAAEMTVQQMAAEMAARRTAGEMAAHLGVGMGAGNWAWGRDGQTGTTLSSGTIISSFVCLEKLIVY